ncbi:MAG: MBL fold metallo-hydrolase RNA specificity domain-containing protein, partial [Saccharolobus sp.]
FLKNIEPKPKNVLLNHGEVNAIRAFANYIREEGRLGYKPNIYTPNILDSIRVV